MRVFLFRTYANSANFLNCCSNKNRGLSMGVIDRVLPVINQGSIGVLGGLRKFGGNRYGAGGGGFRYGGPPRGGMNQRYQDNYASGSNLRKPNWDQESLIPFEKNFYVPHPNVSNRDPNEVSEFRNMHKITLKGDQVPNPIQHFDEGNFPDYVMQGK